MPVSSPLRPLSYIAAGVTLGWPDQSRWRWRRRSQSMPSLKKPPPLPTDGHRGCPDEAARQCFERRILCVRTARASAAGGVQQLPLAAKQMLGAARSFVSEPETCQRLPELALLAGSILTYLAASEPAIPTGSWDRRPRPTPGRLRRLLARTVFPTSVPLPDRIRQKAAVTDHLPTGNWGQRRRPTSVPDASSASRPTSAQTEVA